jgi:hypothetical protein
VGLKWWLCTQQRWWHEDGPAQVPRIWAPSPSCARAPHPFPFPFLHRIPSSSSGIHSIPIGDARDPPCRSAPKRRRWHSVWTHPCLMSHVHPSAISSTRGRAPKPRIRGPLKKRGGAKWCLHYIIDWQTFY